MINLCIICFSSLRDRILSKFLINLQNKKFGFHNLEDLLDPVKSDSYFSSFMSLHAENSVCYVKN